MLLVDAFEDCEKLFLDLIDLMNRTNVFVFQYLIKSNHAKLIDPDLSERWGLF